MYRFNRKAYYRLFAKTKEYRDIKLSFESGKKLGLISSIINVIAPVISITLGILWAFIQISNIYQDSLTVTPNPTSQIFLNEGALTALIVLTVVIMAIYIISNALFFLSSNHLAKYYGYPSIAGNVRKGFIIYIISYVVSALSSFVTITLLSQGIIDSVSFIFTIVNWVLSSFAAYFYWQTFNNLSGCSNEGKFKTAGLLLFIGSLTTIIVIGGLIVWIAWIVAASAFNALTPRQKQQEFNPYSPQIPGVPPNLYETNYCTNCGAPVNKSMAFCPNCGKTIQSQQDQK